MVAAEGPDFLDEPVVQLAVPFAGEQANDFFPARDKPRSLPVLSAVGLWTPARLPSGVPAVFSARKRTKTPTTFFVTVGATINTQNS
jgi:hypothetical protein